MKKCNSLCRIAILLLCNALIPAIASPVYMPQFLPGGTGRNIRHLPCVTRKTGETGVCMFAFTCAKANGTHLGTCIDRFYFGSCCKIEGEPDIFPDDNSIDEGSIKPFVTTHGPIESNNIPVYSPKPQQSSTTAPVRTTPLPNTTKEKFSTTRTPIKSTGKPSLPTGSTLGHKPTQTGATKKPIIESTTGSFGLSTFQTVQDVPQKLPPTTTGNPTRPSTQATTIKTSPRPKPTTPRPKPTLSKPSTPPSRPKPRPSQRPSVSSTTRTTTSPPTLLINTTEGLRPTTFKPKATTRRPPTTTTQKPTSVTRFPPRNVTSTTTKPIRPGQKPTRRPIEVTTKYTSPPVTRPTASSTSRPMTTSRIPVTSSQATRPTIPASVRPISPTRKRPSTTERPVATTVRVTIDERPPTTASNIKLTTTTRPATIVGSKPLSTQSVPSEGYKPTTTTKRPRPSVTAAVPVKKPPTTVAKPTTTTGRPSSATTAPPVSIPVTKQPSPTPSSVRPPATSSLLSNEVSQGQESQTEKVDASGSEADTIEPTGQSPGLVTWTFNSDELSTKTPDASISTPSSEEPTNTEWTPITTPDGWILIQSPVPNKQETIKITSTTEATTKPMKKPSTPGAPVLEVTTTERITQRPTVSSMLSTIATVTMTTDLEIPMEALNMSDYKQVCGRRMFPESRIVGGKSGAFGKWPWQISLRQWRTSTYLHKCGAALLNENWAITAAHCVENVPPSDLLLRIGEHDLASEDEPYGFQERRVQIVASHPQFDPRTFEYDLALLRFYEPLQPFQPNALPICLPDDDANYVGLTAYVTGWGRLYDDGPLPSILQEVSVPVINNTVCESMYRSAGYIEHIPEIFICAGWRKGGYDSCEGDSGGPMVIQRPRDKRWILAGVISWGIGCAEPNQPGVYTRISEFREWINQILQF